MDIPHLRHFIALADSLHFGQAAKSLGIAQPALSQSIKRLEVTIGVKLFDRSRRQVALTPAGKVLLQEGREVIARAELALSLTRRAAAEELDTLRIGFTPWALMRSLPRAVRNFQAKWPGVSVQLDELASKRQILGLRDGSLDLGVINVHAVDARGLDTRVVERSRIMAAVPSAWPIAKKKQVRMADLSKLPFILFPHSWSPLFYATVMSACRKAGFTPNVTQKARQTHVMLNMIGSELGVTLLNDTARHVRMEGVKLIPISDFSEDYVVESSLAWIPRAMSPVLRAFIDALDEEIQRSS
jgi:DNA-binding transcriptional LysR family regulator